jgi:Domain of unknown function (DUF4518)
MNTSDKYVMRNILNRMELVDVLVLAKSLTNSCFDNEDKNKAIEICLLYCVDTIGLLEKKCIHKKIVSQFLIDHRIKFHPRDSKTKLINTIRNVTTLSNNIGDNNYDMDEPSASSIANVFCPKESRTFAIKFIDWYFEMWDCRKKYSILDSSHFWDNSQMKIYLPHKDYVINGSTDIVNTLNNFSAYDILFSPQCDHEDSLKIEDSNGLFVLSVNGIVQKKSSLIGMFNKTFGLARDPYKANTWNVKFIELRIQPKPEYLNQLVSSILTWSIEA